MVQLPTPVQPPTPGTQPPIATHQTPLFRQAIERFNAEGIQKPKNYPLILVIGDSGTGKSRSIHGLPPEETAIINVEGKMLSFEGQEKFPFQFSGPFNRPEDVETTIKTAFREPAIKYIVVDSFTKWLEILRKFCRETYGDDKNSYKQWDVYSTCISNFLEGIKSNGPKFVILTGIPELLSETRADGSTSKTRRLAVAGKQWEGKIEKEFTLCLYTDATKIGTKVEYKFLTNTDGSNSAKTPEGMFPEAKIDNNLKLVCDRVEAFYKLKG